MECQFCNVEMVYKPNIRGLYSPGMDHNINNPEAKASWCAGFYFCTSHVD